MLSNSHIITSTQLLTLNVTGIRIGMVMHHRPTRTTGMAVAILVFNVLSHSQLYGMESNSIPRSESQLKKYRNAMATKRVCQNPLM